MSEAAALVRAISSGGRERFRFFTLLAIGRRCHQQIGHTCTQNCSDNTAEGQSTLLFEF